MKKMFDFAMVSGILIIIAGAGGYETMSASFAKSFVIMLFGAMLMAFGAYGKERYAGYLRRCVNLKKKKIVKNDSKIFETA